MAAEFITCGNGANVPNSEVPDKMQGVKETSFVTVIRRRAQFDVEVRHAPAQACLLLLWLTAGLTLKVFCAFGVSISGFIASQLSNRDLLPYIVCGHKA